LQSPSFLYALAPGAERAEPKHAPFVYGTCRRILGRQHIESQFKDKHVWMPTKDIGVDLLVTNSANTKAVTLQVKFSRDFLPIMKLRPSVLTQLKSCAWFSVDRHKLTHSGAHYWILVLLGFEERSYDYAIIKPNALLKKLQATYGGSSRNQVYVWLTKQKQAWLSIGLKKEDQDRIAEGTFVGENRDLTKYLNDWSAIKNL
jgi:hypothetical protein